MRGSPRAPGCTRDGRSVLHVPPGSGTRGRNLVVPGHRQPFRTRSTNLILSKFRSHHRRWGSCGQRVSVQVRSQMGPWTACGRRSGRDACSGDEPTPSTLMSTGSDCLPTAAALLRTAASQVVHILWSRSFRQQSEGSTRISTDVEGRQSAGCPGESTELWIVLWTTARLRRGPCGLACDKPANWHVRHTQGGGSPFPGRPPQNAAGWATEELLRSPAA
mgnify:CR=1 FL=1